MNRTICIGIRQVRVSPSIAVVTSNMRSTCQYCMVSALVWLWFVMILVVTESDSVAAASRMPVRLALRRAAAWFSAEECVVCAAFCAESRWPCIHVLLFPDDDDPPAPPLAMMIDPPADQLSESAWNELPPLAASVKAELNVAAVEVSLCALCWEACCSLKLSLSNTWAVSVRSNTATSVCSPGASGSE